MSHGQVQCTECSYESSAASQYLQEDPRTLLQPRPVPYMNMTKGDDQNDLICLIESFNAVVTATICLGQLCNQMRLPWSTCLLVLSDLLVCLAEVAPQQTNTFDTHQRQQHMTQLFTSQTAASTTRAPHGPAAALGGSRLPSLPLQASLLLPPSPPSPTAHPSPYHPSICEPCCACCDP
jgi:hypothetical protein